jgi:hypothetical protein
MYTVLNKQLFLFVPHNTEKHIYPFKDAYAYLITFFINSTPLNCVTSSEETVIKNMTITTMILLHMFVCCTSSNVMSDKLQQKQELSDSPTLCLISELYPVFAVVHKILMTTHESRNNVGHPHTHIRSCTMLLKLVNDLLPVTSLCLLFSNVTIPGHR